jgi:hypothetical protein
MNAPRRRGNGAPTTSTRTAQRGALDRAIEAVVQARTNGSRTVTASVAAPAAVSSHRSRALQTVSAKPLPPIDVAMLRVEPTDAVVAGDALARALRHVPHTPISVVGSRAGAVARWLRRNGHHADPLKPQAEGETTRQAILAPDLLEASTDASQAFAAIRQMLAPDGVLIAVVPNLMHARTRIAVLLGRFPAHHNGSGAALTLDAVDRALHEAAFTVVDIERQIDSRDALQDISEGVPESVVNMLANDIDAMTSHFVIVAEPTVSASVGRCHRRIGEISNAQRATTREVARVEGRVADLEVRVQHWASETDRLALRDVTQEVAARSQANTRLEDELRGLSERLASDRAGEVERDALLNRARESLLSRIGDIKALTSRIEHARYRREVVRIRQLVCRHVPAGSIVAVVSRGDDELLAFDRRRGWHFPRTDKGVYAGHHPADSTAAIAHIEELRKRGARYLLIPRTGFWWLEHYTELRDYLEYRCRRVWRDERTCVLYALARRRAAK